MDKSNKEIVIEVLTRAFVEKDPTVVTQCFGANYKQHNPVIPDGPAAIAKLIPTLTGAQVRTRHGGCGWRPRNGSWAIYRLGTQANGRGRHLQGRGWQGSGTLGCVAGGSPSR